MLPSFFKRLPLAKHAALLACAGFAAGCVVFVCLDAVQARSFRPHPGKRQAAAKKKRGTISTNGKPVVMDLSAEWCGPCKKLAPIFAKVKSAYADKADFQSLDVEKDGKAIADRFSVEEVPTILIFDASGKLQYTHAGLLPEQELSAAVKKVVH